MNLKYVFFLSVFFSLALVSCDNDDDDVEPIPERDRGEQAIEDEEALMNYLETHFYNYEDFENPSEDFDYKVRFDTISGDNADKTPIIDSDDLIIKTTELDDIDYTYYVLKVREGEGEQPKFSDSTFVSYEGQLLNRTTFDASTNPVWFDLVGYDVINQNGQVQRMGGVIPGFAKALPEFKTSTGFVVNPDNTVSWNNDYGIGAVFLPSGMGYFSSGQGSIPPYSPLIFSFKLHEMDEADHDRDGIPSWMEDIDDDGNLFNDNTDGNRLSNHSDRDDDGDGTLTEDEIEVDEEGNVNLIDSNDDGVPDYLDPDTFK